MLPPAALDAWLLAAAGIAGIVYLFVYVAKRLPAGQRFIIVAGMSIGMLSVIVGEVVGLAVYIPWEAAAGAWSFNQGNQLLARGCSLSQLNHIYDLTQASANHFNVAGQLLMFGGVVLVVFVVAYRIYSIRRSRQINSIT